MSLKQKLAAVALALPFVLAGCVEKSDVNAAPSIPDKVVTDLIAQDVTSSVSFNRIVKRLPQDGLYIISIPANKVPELNRKKPLVCVYGYKDGGSDGGAGLTCDF